jgi:hypothetical protein
MRKGTLGSHVGWGILPGDVCHALLMARTSRSRAFCTSWSIRTVALLSGSQVTALYSAHSPFRERLRAQP